MTLHQDGYWHYGARCWVKFSSNGSILDDRNISSVSDNGTGKFTVNIDTDLPNANYAVVCDGRRDGDVGHNECSFNSCISNEGGSSFKVGCQDNNSDGYRDPSWVAVIVVR